MPASAAAGAIKLFSLNVTVISREVSGFFTGDDPVGRRQALFDPLELGAGLGGALVAVLAVLFEAFQGDAGEVVRDLGLTSRGSRGFSPLCFMPTVNGVSPSKGTRPVSIS
jgi:hypothetical protein